MAFDLTKITIVNVLDPEVQKGNDISCSEEKHNDRGKEL
jgi:hypothetical protein